MDYKALLKKYMQHVCDCEGIDFVDRLDDRQSDVEFTAEEKSELERISAERYA